MIDYWLEIILALVGGAFLGHVNKLISLPSKLRGERSDQDREDWHSISSAYDDMQLKLQESLTFTTDLATKYRKAIVEIESLRGTVEMLTRKLKDCEEREADN